MINTCSLTEGIVCINNNIINIDTPYSDIFISLSLSALLFCVIWTNLLISTTTLPDSNLKVKWGACSPSPQDKGGSLENIFLRPLVRPRNKVQACPPNPTPRSPPPPRSATVETEYLTFTVFCSHSLPHLLAIKI